MWCCSDRGAFHARKTPLSMDACSANSGMSMQVTILIITSFPWGEGR